MSLKAIHTDTDNGDPEGKDVLPKNEEEEDRDEDESDEEENGGAGYQAPSSPLNIRGEKSKRLGSFTGLWERHITYNSDDDVEFEDGQFTPPFYSSTSEHDSYRSYCEYYDYDSDRDSRTIYFKKRHYNETSDNSSSYDENEVVSPFQGSRASFSHSSSSSCSTLATPIKSSDSSRNNTPVDPWRLFRKKKKKKNIEKGKEKTPRTNNAAFALSLMLRKLLPFIPLSNWGSLKSTCKTLYYHADWKNVEFLRNCLSENTRNYKICTFWWDSIFVNEKFLQNAARVAARNGFLGGKQLGEFTMKHLTPNVPLIRTPLELWRVNEFKMIQMPAFNPLSFEDQLSHCQSSLKRPSFEMILLPKCAPRPYGNCLVIVSHTYYISVYNPRTWDLMTGTPLESCKIFSSISCNDEGTRVVIFMTNQNGNIDASCQQHPECRRLKFVDADIEVYSLDEQNGLKYMRSIWLDRKIDLLVSLNCLWSDNTLIAASRLEKESSIIIFHQISLDNPKEKEVVFNPQNFFHEPDYTLCVNHPPRYQTLMPLSHSPLEAMPLLCWLPPCEGDGEWNLMIHQVVFFENAFGNKPIKYFINFKPGYTIKAVARMESPDLVLILTSCKFNEERVQPISVEITRYEQIEEEENGAANRGSSSFRKNSDCKHPYFPFYRRAKFLKLFAWKVGSPEAICIRHIQNDMHEDHREKIVLGNTYFDSALKHRFYYPPVTILVDGYWVIVPTSHSLVFTAVTNLKNNLEVCYNRVGHLHMPYTFSRDGVTMQITCITRTALPFPRPSNIRSHTDKLFFAVKIFSDSWTRRNALNNRLFLKPGLNKHQMRPPKLDQEVRIIHMIDMLAEDGVLTKELEQRFANTVVRIGYRNVGRLSSSNRI